MLPLALLLLLLRDLFLQLTHCRSTKMHQLLPLFAFVLRLQAIRFRLQLGQIGIAGAHQGLEFDALFFLRHAPLLLKFQEQGLDLANSAREFFVVKFHIFMDDAAFVLLLRLLLVAG